VLRRHSGQRVWAPSRLEAWERHGLVGHWVGGGAGLLMEDASGYGNHGTLTNGPTWTLGREGGRNAVTFDSSNDRVLCGAGVKEVQDHTLAAWIFPTALTGRRIIAAKSASILSSGVEWAMERDSGFLTWAYNDGSIRGWFDSTTFGPRTNLWTHVAFTWVRSTGNSRFYVDGSAMGSASTSTNAIVYSGDSFDMGFQSNNVLWGGSLEDVRLYDRALTGAEIARLADPSRRLTAMGKRGRLDVPPPPFSPAWAYGINQVLQPAGVS